MIVTRLDVLDPSFREQIRAVLAEAMERKAYFVITETVRTFERQKELFDAGKSRTMHSAHLVGKAVDLVPVVSFSDGVVQEVSWEKVLPAWGILGELAQKHGVVWGGTWQSFPDYPHLQVKGWS